MWWLFALALAAAPEDLDAEETATWETAWEPLFEGPPGCWEVVGKASYQWDFGPAGYVDGTAAFMGLLQDGVWRGMHIKSLGEDAKWRLSSKVRQYPHDEQHFVPMVGKRIKSQDEMTGSSVTESLIDAVFTRLGTNVDYAYSEWDDASNSVVLHRVLPIGESAARRPEAKMDVYFPQGGTLPTYAKVIFDEPFSLPDFKLARVKQADARLRGKIAGGLVFPEAETFSFTAGVLGFSVTGAQTISYSSFRPCGGDVESVTKPIGD